MMKIQLNVLNFLMATAREYKYIKFIKNYNCSILCGLIWNPSIVCSNEQYTYNLPIYSHLFFIQK